MTLRSEEINDEGSRGAFELNDTNEDTLDLEDDDEAQPSQSNRSGVRIRTTDDVDGLECRLSSKTDGVVTAYLTTDTGEVLERQTVATLGPGETFAFESELEAEEVYWVLCDASRRNYVRGRAEVDYPIESDSLVATHGIYTGSGTRTDDYRYCLDQITPGGTSSQIGGTLALESDDEAQPSQSNRSGIRVQATNGVSGLECRLSAETEGVTTAYLTDDSGTVLEQQAVDRIESGETFAFESELEAGEVYWVLCDARGRNYVRGRAEVDYPIESDSLEATHGIYTGSGTRTDSYRYCLDRIQPATLDLEIGATLALESDDEAQRLQSNRSGVRVRVTDDVDGFACRISAETEGLATAYLVSDSGAVLERQTVATLGPGETFAFESELEAGEVYWVLCDARGRNYVRGRAEVDYPIESDSLEATHGIYTGSGTRTDSYRYCLDRITTDTGGDFGATLDLENDDEAQPSQSNRSGVRVQATNDVDGLECRLSAETEGATAAYLTDDSGTVLEQRAIDRVESGETFSFETGLEAEEAYWVLCDADGRNYVRGRTEVDYPIESDSLEATHGIYTGGGTRTDDYRYCLDRVRPEPDSRGMTSALKTRPLDVTTVDVTEHPSIDENGDLSAELLDYLESQSEINHEIVLPEGSYGWNTTFSLPESVEYFEIRGDPRAVLRIRNHDVSVAFEFGTWVTDDPPQHVVVRNVDVDIGDQPERDAGLIIAHVGRCLIDNVELVGQRDLHGPYSGNRYTFLINTRNENALSLIRNVSATDGEIEDPDEPMVGSHTIGFSADPPHEGVNVWKQCLVEDFVSSGYYVRNSPGENIMYLTAAANCGNSGIRLGAADEARDCKIIYDDMSGREYAGAGLWFNGGQPIAERIEIDGTESQNDIVRINSGADGGHIRDLSVFCGPDVVAPTVRCTATDQTDQQGILIEDFVITDVTEADESPSVRIHRSDVTLRSGVVNAENRPALGGTEGAVIDDVYLR